MAREKAAQLELGGGAQMTLHLKKCSLRHEELCLLLGGTHHRREEMIGIREWLPQNRARERNGITPDAIIDLDRLWLWLVPPRESSDHAAPYWTRTGRTSVDGAVSSTTPKSRTT